MRLHVFSHYVSDEQLHKIEFLMPLLGGELNCCFLYTISIFSIVLYAIEKGEFKMKLTTNHHFILASESPRRKELFGKLGIPFEVISFRSGGNSGKKSFGRRSGYGISRLAKQLQS